MTKRKLNIKSNNLENNDFTEQYSFYLFMAHDFANAASKLEEIASIADRIWSDEFKKLNIQPGEIRKGAGSIEMHIAGNDRRCRAISIYLFAHSLELSLKGIYIKNTSKNINTHKITTLYDKTKQYINIKPNSFETSELTSLFSALDELLIWAGRYPSPNKQNIANAIKNFASIGYKADPYCLSNAAEAVNRSVHNNNGVYLMKNFLQYLLSHFSPFMSK